MIVQCNQCSSRYRVNEAKLPPGGGNIKCPSCAHVFFVQPPTKGGMDDLPRRPGGARTNPLDDETAIGKIPNEVAEKFGIDTAAKSPPAASATAKGSESDKWKLKTNFGLVYDFPDASSLRNWLSARDDLGGYQLSPEGGAFRELSYYDHILTPTIAAKLKKGSAPAVTAPAQDRANTGVDTSNFFPEEDEEDRKLEAQIAAARKAQQEPEQKKEIGPIQVVAAPPAKQRNRPVWLAVVFLLMVFVAFALQITGTVDLLGAIPFGSSSSPPPIASTDPVAGASEDIEDEVEEEEEVDEPEDDLTAKEETETTAKPVNPLNAQKAFDTLIEQAEAELNANEYDKAVSTLKLAGGLKPRRVEVYQLLERAYSGMGREDDAEQMREKVRTLEGG